jgi:hypothetical protein
MNYFAGGSSGSYYNLHLVTFVPMLYSPLPKLRGWICLQPNPVAYPCRDLPVDFKLHGHLCSSIAG